MKLFIVAALVSVAAAARLEHLERSYLPPSQGSSQGNYGSQSSFNPQGSSGFGSSGFGSSGSLGSSGSHGLGGHNGFGSGSFDSNGIDGQAAGRYSGFGSAATINQYLPPDHGPSGSNGAQFSGSLQGFGNGNVPSQYGSQSSFSGASHNSAPSSQYGVPSFGSQGRYQNGGSQQFGQGPSQYSAASRQYQAPKSSNYPQQSFDEQTGYHY